jgi:hypothetical protein
MEPPRSDEPGDDNALGEALVLRMGERKSDLGLSDGIQHTQRFARFHKFGGIVPFTKTLAVRCCPHQNLLPLGSAE